MIQIKKQLKRMKKIEKDRGNIKKYINDNLNNELLKYYNYNNSIITNPELKIFDDKIGCEQQRLDTSIDLREELNYIGRRLILSQNYLFTYIKSEIKNIILKKLISKIHRQLVDKLSNNYLYVMKNSKNDITYINGKLDIITYWKLIDIKHLRKEKIKKLNKINQYDNIVI